jgi:uroporphyrinogen decarboxylase
MISSWSQFERFPWDEVEPDLSPFELAARCLPDGMKIAACSSVFEHILERVLGYNGLFTLLYDEPELVRAVFARWGQMVYEFYESVVGSDAVGALFHGDDLGFKTSTLVSPDALRQLVFPWLRKYAELAHAHGKTFWYHCCGNIYDTGVIEDLIEDVQIDALHSFQDVILPVTEFVERYGDRVAALGGVDVDKMVRMPQSDLRAYVRHMLGQCMQGGRFAIGTGNTVANYVPLESYFAMLDECRRY